jgi:fatty acid amide hydrolase
MSTPALHTLPARELASRLARGALDSVTLVEALHARADAVDGRVRGFTDQLRREALREARERDAERAAGKARGPLHGLPVTIKENIHVVGTETTAGLRARAGKRSTSDALLVRALREAGCIVLGKSNVPQTLMAPESTNALWGTTNNPWDLGRAPGGSSGGEAALLASGQSVLGIGTDIAGSIRIPAGFCGVAGLKPTLFRWSLLGSTGALMGMEFVRAVIGPMARTADDLALLWTSLDPRAMATHDPEVVPLPPGDPAAVDISALRVGYYEEDGFFTPSAAVRRAVREAADHLRAAGATLVPYQPPHVEEAYFLGIAGITADGLRTLRRELAGEPVIPQLRMNERLSGLPASVRETVARGLRLFGEERVARTLEALGEKSVEEYWKLSWRRTELQRAEHAAWAEAGIDALLCPGYATPAVPHGASGDFSIGAVGTLRWNLLNRPAGVVPVTRVRPGETTRTDVRDRLDRRAAEIDRGSEGLPVGVQLVAPPWREDVVLALMGAIERRAREGADFPTTPVDPPAA